MASNLINFKKFMKKHSRISVTFPYEILFTAICLQHASAPAWKLKNLLDHSDYAYSLRASFR